MGSLLSGAIFVCVLLVSVATPALARPAVGPVTQFVMPDVSIDDFVFGVAALGVNGSESLVSACVNPPRAESVVKVNQGRPGRPARSPAGVAAVRCTSRWRSRHAVGGS